MKTRCTDAYYARHPSGSAGILYLRDEWYDGAIRAVTKRTEKSVGRGNEQKVFRGFSFVIREGWPRWMCLTAQAGERDVSTLAGHFMVPASES
jgi:hypothetical protein